jgi:hypothetical protein
LVPRVVLLGGGGTFKRWGLVESPWVNAKGDSRALLPTSLLLPDHEMSRYALPNTPVFLCPRVAKSKILSLAKPGSLE